MAVASTGTGLFWLLSNRIEKTPVGRIGILLSITSDDEKEDRQLRADFIAKLRKLLERDPDGARFFVIVLAPHLAKHIAGFPDAGRYLQRLRAHMMLFGTVRKRQMRDKEVHVLSFDGLVRHAPISQPVQQELIQQFSGAIPRQLVVPVDSDFFVFEATSEWTDVATRYVVGLAALVSGDVRYAEGLLLEVERQVAVGRAKAPPLRAIGQRLPRYLGALYEAWLRHLVEEFTLTRADELVPAMEDMSRKLIARDPGNVSARLSAAMCAFLLRRDVPDARQHLYQAKKNAPDPSWQYSIAFLEGYEGSLDNAEKEYEAAFAGTLRDVTVPLQCEEFIQLVIEREPKRTQLHYCSALLNFYPKRDYAGAARDFTAFLEATPADQFRAQQARATLLLEQAQEHVAAQQAPEGGER